VVKQRVWIIIKGLYMGLIDDRYFRFPIKVHDQIDVRIQEKKEEVGYGEDPTEPWWVAGWARLPMSELETLHWHEGFSTGQEKEAVEEDGLDLTIVYSDKYGQLVSTWDIKEFERKLEEFLGRNREKVYIASKSVKQQK
jgi:hypothetical protein